MRSTSVPLSCFTPSTRKTGHIEGTTNILRSISIVALLLIRLNRFGFRRTLLFSRDVWIPAHQADCAIRETVKLWVLAQRDGHRTKPIVVLPALRLEVKPTLFKTRQNFRRSAGLVARSPLAIF